MLIDAICLALPSPDKYPAFTVLLLMVQGRWSGDVNCGWLYIEEALGRGAHNIIKQDDEDL